MTPDPLQERVARDKIAPLICGCGEPNCPRVDAVIAAVLADLREAGELRTLEQVGWAVLKEGITSWRRIEEGTTGGGSQFWRDAVPVYIVREADSTPPACEVCDGTGLWLACDDEWCDDLSHFAPCPRGCREGRT